MFVLFLQTYLACKLVVHIIVVVAGQLFLVSYSSMMWWRGYCVCWIIEPRGCRCCGEIEGSLSSSQDKCGQVSGLCMILKCYV